MVKGEYLSLLEGPMAEAPAGYEARVVRDWHVPQGADTNCTFEYGEDDGGVTPFVGTEFISEGWTAQAQVRPGVGQPPWVVFLSTSGIGPRIDMDDDGRVAIVLPHAATESAEWNGRDVGFYDLEITSPDNERTRLAMGMVIISHDVTRDVI